MARPTTPSAVEAFLGLNDQTPSKIGENQAAILRNLYVFNDQRELVRRGGTAPLTGTGDENAFDGLFFTRINGTDYLLASHNGDIEDWLDSGAVVSGGSGVLTSGTPAGAAFLMSNFNQAIYFGDGAKQNVRFDGTSVKRVMSEQPDASAMLAFTSGVGVLNGTYFYQVTFLSADGQDSQVNSYPNNNIGPGVNVATPGQVQLTNIPTSTDPDCTGRRIWRRNPGATVSYLLTTLNDNTTTTYLDNIADTSLDSSIFVDESNVRFPPCQILVAHQLRLAGILCGTADGDNRTLYISDQLKPWYCPEVLLYADVDDPTQGARVNLPDVPVGMAVHGTDLIVFFQRQAWRLAGIDPSTWEFQKWLDTGCASHRTIRSYKYSLIWLAADGVYMVSPAVSGIMGSTTKLERISDNIRAHLDAISPEDFSKAHAFIWYDRYYLMFPTQAFYFDFRFGVWGELTAWEWDHSTVSDNSGTAKELIYATLHGAGHAWQLETGTSDNGTAIPIHWKSQDKDMGQYGREKRLHRVICNFLATSGTATVNLYRGSGELIQTFTQDLSVPIRPGGTISGLDDRCVEGARDDHFALEVTHQALSSDFRILDIGSHYTLCT